MTLMENVKQLARQNVADIQALTRWNQDVTPLTRMNDMLVAAIQKDDPDFNPNEDLA